MNIKHSKPRDIILEIVLNSYNHPTAQEVYEQARTKISNISLGTVYRNLSKLYEQGLIKKITISNVDRFDNSLLNHFHIYCINCHKVFDIPSVILDEIEKLITDNTSYQILNIVFEGLCHNCKERK